MHHQKSIHTLLTQEVDNAKHLFLVEKVVLASITESV